MRWPARSNRSAQSSKIFQENKNQPSKMPNKLGCSENKRSKADWDSHWYLGDTVCWGAVFHDLCETVWRRRACPLWIIAGFWSGDILSVFDMQPGARQHQLQPDSFPAGEFLQQMFFLLVEVLGFCLNIHTSFVPNGVSGRQHELYIDHP